MKSNNDNNPKITGNKSSTISTNTADGTSETKTNTNTNITKDKYITENRWFITSSKLKVFIKNPEEYKLKYIDEIESGNEESTPLIIWQALDHLLSYWEELFFKKYEILEPRKRRVENSDRIQITNWNWEMILNMLKEIKRQPLSDFEWKYEPQQEVIAKYKDLKLKWTIDRFDLENKIIRDWKTTQSISKFRWQIEWEDQFEYIFQYNVPQNSDSELS